jgi:hypothetical protein
MDTALFLAIHDVRMLDSAAARRAVQRLHHSGVVIVPVTELTLDEIAPLAAGYGFRHAIVEAGGAIARLAGGAWSVEPCGADADALLDAVMRIEDQTGARLFVGDEERRFSEPFAIESGKLDAIRRAAARFGFRLRRGREQFHLCRIADEGAAFTRLRDELACDLTIGAGSAEIDEAFLSRVDVAIATAEEWRDVIPSEVEGSGRVGRGAVPPSRPDPSTPLGMTM